MTQRVATNIITGFLGAGKTTTILHLLKHKPANEKWAVLVNEFGEIGIDGALLTEQGAMIKEIPGGCMCCTAGVPMSVGINALLRTKPDRLLIEPTGLGHPKEVTSKLLSEQFSPYVDLKATIALVDPRHVSNEKYTSNQNFNDQLDSAQIIVANKSDQSTEQDLDNLILWFDGFKNKHNHNIEQLHLVTTSQGELDLSLLDHDRIIEPLPTSGHSGHSHDHLDPSFGLEPGQKYVRKENKGQGYFSCGWLFGAELTFNFDQLFSMLSALTAERVKAVMSTDQGCYAFNVSNGVVSVNQMTLEGYESRIEVIDSQLMPWQQLEDVLLSLILP
ncbi:CobW family GTP-binding protein [Vibrio rumoiensis]|uniref:GTPase n=1 Tax=Vibrio rumoiensis 1S-45 TaxID=1188252 RepID=A0A1E5DZ15_9VIBR|nr:GTP-binding protein [Vibrio rumoiensis]OEF23144.1 GTPase [Vibrio rumoiensis 1S-45]